jgi:signal transduction histidine kinase
VSWVLAALLVVAVARLRRRLELVARAEHELRGPLTAVALAAESIRRGRSVDLEAELLRARLALDDLTAARRGRRARSPRADLERIVRSSAHSWGASVDWRAGSVRSDARAAQAVGNLLANAAEHGDGDTVVRVEIVNKKREPVAVPVRVADRGRGLGIAAAAARDAGGSLAVGSDGREFRATLDLPLTG